MSIKSFVHFLIGLTFNLFVLNWKTFIYSAYESFIRFMTSKYFLPIRVLSIELSIVSFDRRRQFAPHSSTLAWKIPWAEEPGRLQSMRSLRVEHDWATSLSIFTFHFHALEKEMATHSSALAWRIPGTGEPGGLLSMGSHRVGHDWSVLAATAAAAAAAAAMSFDT